MLRWVPGRGGIKGSVDAHHLASLCHFSHEVHLAPISLSAIPFIVRNSRNSCQKMSRSLLLDNHAKEPILHLCGPQHTSCKGFQFTASVLTLLYQLRLGVANTQKFLNRIHRASPPILVHVSGQSKTWITFTFTALA